MNRAREVGAFLRLRREALAPADVGLGDRARRHVPGLRREEVAALAGIGTSWYAMLEQGRVARVGRTTLERLASALRLTPVERAYLLALATDGGESSRAADDDDALASLARTVADIAPAAAVVADERAAVRAWNPHADAYFHFSATPSDERNMLAMMVRDPSMRSTFPTWAQTLRHMAHVFRHRSAAANDARFDALARDLAAESPEFARAWNERGVVLPRHHRCRLRDERGVEHAFDFHALAPIDVPSHTLVLLSPV